MRGASASATTKVSSAFGRKRDSNTRPRYSCVIPRSRPCPTASTTVTPTWPVCSSTASITISTRSRSTTASTFVIAAVSLRRERVLDQHLRGGRLDRLQDAAGDAVGIGHRVGPAIFEVAAVAVAYEAVRDADRRPAVGDAVGEVADRRRFVEAGQA